MTMNVLVVAVVVFAAVGCRACIRKPPTTEVTTTSPATTTATEKATITTTSEAITPKGKCPDRSKLSSVIVSKSFGPSNSDIGFDGKPGRTNFTTTMSMKSIDTCLCESGHTKYFFNSTTRTTGLTSYNNDQAVAFIHSYDDCPQFCACDQSGACYARTDSNDTNGVPTFINSYCDSANGCNVVLNIFCRINSHEGLKYWVRDFPKYRDNDYIKMLCGFHGGEPYSSAIGTFYLPITSFGCNGCEELRTIEC